MIVDITTHVIPNSRVARWSEELPDACREAYDDMTRAGYHFEVEVLSVGAPLSRLQMESEM